AVAREDPAGFTLLWRHAAREPKFAEHADEFRARAVGFANSVLSPVLTGSKIEQRWAAETMVTYVIGAVLHWLEAGRATGDEAVVSRISASLPAMVQAWASADAERTHVRYSGRRGRAQMEAG